jgi:hypothetical protein
MVGELCGGLEELSRPVMDERARAMTRQRRRSSRSTGGAKLRAAGSRAAPPSSLGGWGGGEPQALGRRRGSRAPGGGEQNCRWRGRSKIQRRAPPASIRVREKKTTQHPSRGSLLHPQEKGPEGGIWVPSYSRGLTRGSAGVHFFLSAPIYGVGAQVGVRWNCSKSLLHCCLKPFKLF